MIDVLWAKGSTWMELITIFSFHVLQVSWYILLVHKSETFSNPLNINPLPLDSMRIVCHAIIFSFHWHFITSPSYELSTVGEGGFWRNLGWNIAAPKFKPSRHFSLPGDISLSFNSEIVLETADIRNPVYWSFTCTQ